jgi:hypothetical protein
VKINTPIVSKRRTDLRGQSLRFKISKFEKKSSLSCRQAGFQGGRDGLVNWEGDVLYSRYTLTYLELYTSNNNHLRIPAFPGMTNKQIEQFSFCENPPLREVRRVFNA